VVAGDVNRLSRPSMKGACDDRRGKGGGSAAPPTFGFTMKKECIIVVTCDLGR
jgi:hypothetical protein